MKVPVGDGAAHLRSATPVLTTSCNSLWVVACCNRATQGSQIAPSIAKGVDTSRDCGSAHSLQRSTVEIVDARPCHFLQQFVGGCTVCGVAMVSTSTARGMSPNSYEKHANTPQSSMLDFCHATPSPFLGSDFGSRSLIYKCSQM